MDSKAPTQPRIRFGLRTVFIVMTGVALVVGFSAARRHRRLAAVHRFESMYVTLESLAREPPAGYEMTGRRMNSDGSDGTSRKFWLRVPSEETDAEIDALLRRLRVHYGSPLIDAGLTNYTGVPSSGPQRDTSAFRDERGESTVLVGIELNDDQTEAEVTLTWLYQEQLGGWRWP